MKLNKTELIDILFIMGIIVQAIFTAMTMLARWNLDVFCVIMLAIVIGGLVFVFNSETYEED